MKFLTIFKYDGFMAKSKLTLRQIALKTKQRQQHLLAGMDTSTSDSNQNKTGRVISLYGLEADVESPEGKIYRCKLRKHFEPIVVGDSVIWQPLNDTDGVIEALMLRRTLLYRPGKDGKHKPIAANIDNAFIVIAPKPKPAFQLLDSYLVMMETLHLKPVIVLNKMDLLSSSEKKEFEEWLSIYSQLSYPILQVSAINGEGVNNMKSYLNGQCSILVGQSGVGKSSLLQSLLPGHHIKVGIKTEHIHGLHTTTAARLFHLSSGGDIIDTPGVRDFILWNMKSTEIAAGFIEFREFLGLCRFNNCIHFSSLDCALQKALEKGKISQQRYKSYQRMLEFALSKEKW
ncbi:MAG: Small ribosomal subunit biogenesis GTPase RsgA [Legionellaceae bacterium]